MIETAIETARSGRSRRIGGSFRDPSGYVFERDGRILRAVDGARHGVLTELRATGLFDRLVADGLLIDARAIDDRRLIAELAEEHAPYDCFVEHQRVWPVGYPYEWCTSMLADAAIHTLDLQARLLESGYSLKDATPYNVQFANSQSTFIDVASIERPRRLDAWYALAQFHRMFTFPLALATQRGWDLRSYFLGAHEGRSLDQAACALGWRRLLPRWWLDLTLPWLAERRASRRMHAATDADVVHTRRAPSERRATDEGSRARLVAAQLWNLRRIRRHIVALARGNAPRSGWSRYTCGTSYSAEGASAKEQVVREWLSRAAPQRVLDIGANHGDYSLMAAAGGARVVAIDRDHDSVDALYRRVRGSGLSITPLVADVAEPSPAVGPLGHERAGLVERIESGCVLALAVVHHLRVGAQLRLPAIAALFELVAREHLIVEFVPREDAMFSRLMTDRVDDLSDYSIGAFRKAMATHFAVVEERAMAGSMRTLFWMRKIL